MATHSSILFYFLESIHIYKLMYTINLKGSSTLLILISSFSHNMQQQVERSLEGCPSAHGSVCPGKPGALLMGAWPCGGGAGPGSVAFVPLVSDLVGGGQVQTEAQVAPQEEAQHHDKAHQEEDPWEGQEQVLNKEDRVNNLQASEVIDVSLQVQV